jgi:hypothetical protein
MPPQLRLHPSQQADLAEIRDTSPELLRAIAERFRATTPRPMRPKEMHREITQVLGDKPEAASRIIRPLLSLQAIIRQRGLTADEVVDAVRHALEGSDPRWEAGELERWRSVESLFKQLLISPVVRLVSTTLDLMYEYENLLQSARVVTDIRPVFSENASRIDGSVVSHTLRIRYDSTEGDHSISIAMDESDMRELEKQCKRALLKAQTARILMAEQANVPTVISGDDSDAEA